MGFDLLAFAGGFAESSMERMDKTEKEAKEFALASTKNMYKKYSDRIEEDKLLAKETADDLAIIQGNFVDGNAFTKEQLAQIAASPANRKAIVEAIKTGTMNFANIKPAQMVKLAESNAPTVALDKIIQAGQLDKTLNDKLTEQKTFGQMYKGFYSDLGSKAGKDIEEKTARAFGTTVEEMKTKLAEKRPEATASFNLTGLKPRKGSKDLIDEVKVRAIEARQAGDVEGEKNALIDYAVLQAYDAKPKTETEKEKLEENKARLTNLAAKGGKEGAAAQKQLDAYTEIEARALRQKQIKPAGEDEEKVPSLGTLNSFARDAGSIAVDMVHGKQLGKQLSRTQMPDGTISLQYIGDNPEFAAQVDDTRRKAALRALSRYPANNRNVQSVLSVYEPVAAAKETPAPPPPTKPTLPVIAPKNAPAAPASPTAGPKPSIGQERAAALDAIRQGANEAKVKERFKATTGQDL